MSESESERPSEGPTILIVEDDDLTASQVQIGLIGAGYVVLRAASADEALVTLESTQPDLILMSLMLPDADGLILCSMLTTQFHAPIIVLSPRAGDVDRALALESGAVALLSTPVDVDKLLTHVRSVAELPLSAQSRRR